MSGDGGDTDSGAANSACVAGHYVGTFSCSATSTSGALAEPLTGAVDLWLTANAAGDVLAVTSGALLSPSGSATLNADVSGQLSCQSGVFDGLLQGTLSFPPFPPAGTFSGSMTAVFVQSAKLDGTWSWVGETGAAVGIECRGAWSATREPG